jgi:hypothetical protein
MSDLTAQLSAGWSVSIPNGLTPPSHFNPSAVSASAPEERSKKRRRGLHVITAADVQGLKSTGFKKNRQNNQIYQIQ